MVFHFYAKNENVLSSSLLWILDDKLRQGLINCNKVKISIRSIA